MSIAPYGRREASRPGVGSPGGRSPLDFGPPFQKDGNFLREHSPQLQQDTRQVADSATHRREPREEESPSARAPPSSVSPPPPQTATASQRKPFSLSKAVLMGPFAFEAYTDPPRTSGYWQSGRDKNEVAILHEGFLREAYVGKLRVRVKAVTETRAEAQAVFLKAVGARTEGQGPSGKEGARAGGSVGNPRAEMLAVSVAMEMGEEFVGSQMVRLERVEREEGGESGMGGRNVYVPVRGALAGRETGLGGSVGVAGLEDAGLEAWVPAPRAQMQEGGETLLRFSLRGKEESSLGVAEVDVADLLGGCGREEGARSWERDLLLTAPAGRGHGVEGDDRGEDARRRLAEAASGVRVRVEMVFTPLARPSVSAPSALEAPACAEMGAGADSGLGVSQDARDGGSEEAGAGGGETEKRGREREKGKGREWVGARGCSRDWRELAEALGGEAVRAADLELLCFLENRVTDTQLKVWRDRAGTGGRKRLLVAFRGTEFWKVRDLITDMKLLQDPWAVHELDKREGGKEGRKTEVSPFLATAQASPQESREQEGSREARWSEEGPQAETGEGRSGTEMAASRSPTPGLDFYAALATQANRTYMLYNDMDRAVKETFGYVWRNTPFFGALPPSAPASPPPSAPFSSHAAPQPFSGSSSTGTPPRSDLPLHAPGCPSSPSPAPLLTAPAKSNEEAITSVLMAVLDRVMGNNPLASSPSLPSSPPSSFFVQPLSGQVRSPSDFRAAFYGLASDLGRQLFPAPPSASPSPAAGDETDDKREKSQKSPCDPDGRGRGGKGGVETGDQAVLGVVGEGVKSPLLMLPSRFKGVFATLVDETFQLMDSRSFFPSSPPTLLAPRPPSPADPSVFPEADFRASLLQGLDQVVSGLQRKQIEQLAAPTTRARTLSSPPSSPAPPLPFPPRLDAASFGASAEARVHAGFKEAYLSVRPRLLALLDAATLGALEGGRAEDWEILLTGHSLGGALASLCAHDLSSRYAGLSLSMYNFGTPRIGNSAFARAYEESNGDSYRLVNENDAFARFPRNLHPTLFNYEHAGTTVLLNQATFAVQEAASRKKKERADVPQEGNRRGSEALGGIMSGDKIGPSEESAPSVSAGSLELEPLFLEAEWQLLNALLSGAALTSHLEYRYFESLFAAHVSSQAQQGGEGRVEEQGRLEKEAGIERGALGGDPASRLSTTGFDETIKSRAEGFGGMGARVGQWLRGPLKALPLTVAAAEKHAPPSSPR